MSDGVGADSGRDSPLPATRTVRFAMEEPLAPTPPAGRRARARRGGRGGRRGGRGGRTRGGRAARPARAARGRKEAWSAAEGAGEGAGAADELYSFSIEELYSYDLPTAASSSLSRKPMAATAGRRTGGRRRPAGAAAAAAADGAATFGAPGTSSASAAAGGAGGSSAAAAAAAAARATAPAGASALAPVAPRRLLPSMRLVREALLPPEKRAAFLEESSAPIVAGGAGGATAGLSGIGGGGVLLSASDATGGDGSGGAGAAGGGGEEGDDGDSGSRLRDELMGLDIRTGEDAISFFARFGAHSPIKFLHLNRAPTGDLFRPYDLVVVSQKDVDPDHFTMSATGVVHVAPGEPSEFVPLSEWMRQSTIFNMLTSIRFFKFYLTSKMFRTWRSSIRYNHYSQQRARLARKLFLAKEAFCAPLLSVNRLMCDMRVLPLLDLRSPAKAYEASAFVEHQTAKRLEAAKQCEAVVEKTQAVVERVCADVSARASSYDGDDDEDGGLAALLGGAAMNQKSKSMVSIKKEQAARIRALRRAEQESEMLGDFIRLVDYMAVETLSTMTTQTCDALLRELLKSPRRGCMFETTVKFGPSSIIFRPTADDIQGMMSSTTDALITTVHSVPRIIYYREFKPFVADTLARAAAMRGGMDASAAAAAVAGWAGASPSTDGPQVNAIIRNSKRFSAIRAAINDKIAEDFALATEFARCYESVRPIYDFEQTWDFEEYRAREHTVASIKADLARVTDWEKEQLDRMKLGHSEGILHIEARKLKQSLIPIITRAQTRMKALLKELARTRCKELLADYHERLQTLEQKPQHLKEFASHVEKTRAIKTEGKDLSSRTVIVEEMYRLLQVYDVRVPPEDSVQLDDLRAMQTTYATEMDAADNFIDDKMGEMRRQLDANILRLNDQLFQVAQQLGDDVFVDEEAEPPAVLVVLEGVRTKLDHLEELAKMYTNFQQLFNIHEHDYKTLRDTLTLYELKHTLWSTFDEWNRKSEMWQTADFRTIDSEALAADVTQHFVKTSYTLHKKIGDGVSRRLKELVSDFRALVPAIQELGNSAMKERHWDKIFRKLKRKVTGPFALEDLAAWGIFNYKEFITEVSAAASGESQLEASLEKIASGWEDMEFVVQPHRESKDTFILGDLEDIYTLLEDNQVTLQTMMGSRFIVGIQAEVEVWDRKLSLLSDTLDEWVTCQRNWMYLETIFSAEDIQRQLPAESAQFAVVDKTWRDTMRKTHSFPRVINVVADDSQMLDIFQRCNASLEQIQKCLEEYLETKRASFPRFYFLSNDELLEILSETRNPRAVQPHLRKCFDNINELMFEGEEDDAAAAAAGGGAAGDAAPVPAYAEPVPDEVAIMLGMVSGEGERVPFSKPIEAVGPVESWLSDVERGMRSGIYDLVKSALASYPEHGTPAIERGDWIFGTGLPAQAVLVVDQIMWTANVTAAVRAAASGKASALDDFYAFSRAQIEYMVQLVRGDLNKLQRKLMGALVVIDVHAREVVADLAKAGVDSLNAFEWTRQLRLYWEEAIDDCVVRQTNARFVYGYEYLGNTPRLVITPLTDKCYMTLTGALHLRFGGAPAGPAGTGKTETTKDLAKALARQCVVFNCSDGLDYRMMGRFFSGLAQAGAWACFDEFNRIYIEVLSVIAQQILTIQQAITAEVAEFEFEDRIIPLNNNFGVFITMNPGYAGRTELPDNLKALFRPVAMMVPDYGLIAEIILYSEGFGDASNLASKMVQLYKLSSEQLSKQSHYDFGMRAVKSVLVMAGGLKRKEPELSEDVLLIRAMRDSNLPKFLEQDLPLFMGIIRDLFPGVEVPYVDYGRLQAEIEAHLARNSLVATPAFVSKVIQIHETQIIRHGMMLVGESGSGKTTAAETLASALTALFEAGVTDKDGLYRRVQRYTLNPKAVTMDELYGASNPITNEWRDGLVAALVRNAVADTSDARKWVVFDGPVDAIWIENMNTVLDDNKTLCLANSERIKLPSSLHMMFEVMDLEEASPATVSRCGMVYMEAVHVGLLSPITTWVERAPEEYAPATAAVKQLLLEHVKPTLAFLRSSCSEAIPSQDCNLIASFLSLMTAMLRPEAGVPPESVAAGRGSSLLRSLFVFCFTWAFGGNLDDDSTPKFNTWARAALADLLDDGMASASSADIKLSDAAAAAAAAAGGDAAAAAAAGDGAAGDGGAPPAALRSVSSLAPDEGQLFDYYVSTDTGSLRPWAELMKPFSYNPTVPYFNILVPTSETTRHRFLLETLLRSGSNVLFMGETGVGKSVVVADYLASLGGTEDFVGTTVNFSAQTTTFNLQDVFETKLEKKRKNLLGAPAGKRMVIFVDDLNMPALEVYGAQPPVELLRQAIGDGGFYDRRKLFWKSLQGVVYAAAMAPPGGGRNPVTPRLLRLFNMVWLRALSDNSLRTVFGSILGGFLNIELPTLEALAAPLVDASIDMYHRVSEQMLPTPSRSHYTFNLRDLSKVFQGMLMVKREHIGDRDTLIRLWVHEQQRTFRDRLVDDADSSLFDSLTASVLTRHLALDWEVADFTGVLFGDYLSREERMYREIADAAALEELLTEYLEEYNISFSNAMHLVFFRDAIAHISRVCRILRQPRGNALLVGVGGSGRHSLTRLAAFVADMSYRTIEITRGYGPEQWHEDLKAFMRQAGAEGKPVVFCFSDTQIVHSSFLEDINNLLNSGDVPNLLASDEAEAIVSEVRPRAKAAGRVVTRDAVMAYYREQVRENLHIVLCFSPIGDTFRAYCRQFPSLVNCCTIDWYGPWPEDALYSVAMRFLGGAKDLGISDKVEPICTLCVRLHRGVEELSGVFLAKLRRHNYTTPTSYLELIRLYTEMLGDHRDRVTGAVSRYEGGLQKLRETNEMVEQLQVDLVQLQPVLVKAAEDTAALLVDLEKDQAEAEVAAAQAATDEAEATKVADEVQAIKEDCERDLEAAMPAYRKAVKAVQRLDKSSITEMRTFKTPPAGVRMVVEAVCLLFGVKPTWDEGKKLLGRMDFLSSCLNYNKDDIDPRVIRKLKKYVTDDGFTPEAMESVSFAATSLCMWANAMYTYNQVARTIEPKKARLAEAETNLASVMEELSAKRATLAEIEARVAALRAKYEASLEEKDELENRQKDTKLRLVRAEKLVAGLGGEEKRWLASSAQLKRDLRNLVGNILVAAGAIAYLGPFTAEYRSRAVADWLAMATELGVEIDPEFSVQRVLGDPVVVREWNILGLPADEFSIENGLFATLGRRWPLCIDPQGQANRWIKRLEKGNNLQVIKLSEPNFLRTLENGIRYGQSVLLENVEESLDPALEPVLLKQVFKKGGQWLMHLGDSDVPYSKDFRFFITSKMSNPHYMPEVCVKVTIINFTVTRRGLEDQLLVEVVKCERPDLEERRDALIVRIAGDQKQLKDIEDKILAMLANATGDILDDEELINNLDASKTTSAAITERMKEAEATTRDITEAREAYRPVAARGSVLYFVIADLALMDPMYQYSLQFFNRLYVNQIGRSEAADELDARIATLISDITSCMYLNVCRGLFEKDKLVFSFLIATSLMRADGDISAAEWSFFLVGASPAALEAAGEGGDRPPPAGARWLTAGVWAALLSLSELPAFDGLTDELAAGGAAAAAWGEWALAAAPQDKPLPAGWGERLNAFQRLLVLKAFREEKVIFGARTFVGAQLGEMYMESPAFDLDGVYADSDCDTPIIFVLSSGADPMDYLLKLARAKGKDGAGMKIISLGQGQGPIAERLMEAARRDGDWCCLQNCHLAVSWLPRLEAILETAGELDTHADFRLWLTSMPSAAFPVPVLQNGLKLTNEPPKGLRANLQRTFADMSADDFESCSKPRPFKKLMFGLAFYHALCLERRKFGAVGWNIPYGWMNSDLKTAQMQLRMYLEEQPTVPFQTLNAVVGDISYGGRVTDVWDKRTNVAILLQYFVEEALDDSYRYSESGVYYAPPEGDLDSVRAYIRGLPLDDAPEAFGLHENADITFQTKVTGDLMATILSIQPRSGGGGDSGKSGDDTVQELISSIQARLPPQFDLATAHADTFARTEDGSVNSLGVFCGQEIGQFNRLVSVMQDSLAQLSDAIKGLVVMSASLEEMYGAFLFQKVPPQWEKAAYPSLKPLASWVTDLLRRLDFLRSWLTEGPPPAYWLPGFFFPQGFLTGVLQMYARKTRTPVDRLGFQTDITALTADKARTGPPNGAYVYGLFLQGARWSEEEFAVVESRPSVLFELMPIVWLYPVEHAALRAAREKQRAAEAEPDAKRFLYTCPLYKTSRRAGTLSTTGHSTNFVVSLELPASRKQEHWVRRGVALLCQLDD